MRTLEGLGQGEVIVANGAHHGRLDSFASRHPLVEGAIPEESRTFGPVDIKEGVASETPDCAQMSGAEVIAELIQMNSDHAVRDLLWGPQNPTQKRYTKLNERVIQDGLWGRRGSDFLNISPIARARAVLNK